ncbi:flavin reductase family protein [Exilibacterium tricleocarpae]|uniref:Flavin reductase family protein n=1 Tax=Exilibacterium tricleocarpae TaxID=2591008 RepID=A0A545TLC4_9GAMM|nr:flavin reductase family protein [Exilibacterium tricleocarpae]TQV78022.1 flavin reductase family protein [Exilibacterium tricleocarpae]
MNQLQMGEAMKDGMRRLASGVSVLSTRDGEGNRYAMTASSVTSLSDDPPSLLVCVNQATSIHQALECGGPFCVNLLSRDQQDVSVRCATGDQGETRFEVGHWEVEAGNNLPYLQGAQAVFICRQDQCYAYGTHNILIGRIESVMVSDGPVDPLIYLNGRYLTG